MPQPKWKTEQVPSHTFEFINIADFHNNSPWARLRYTWVWIMFFKAILVLGGDIWTCTILIISGDWTSDIKPTIDISIARWIFTACILLSFLLLATDFRKANKVIKSQDISYAVSNKIVSGFYCLQKFNYFCFIEKIHNSSKLHDKLSFFVFFQLKGWKHLVVQAPRQVINIMTLIAFMKALGFDVTNLDDVAQLLPSLRTADKFTFCVMVFTSLMFIFSGVATLIAIILWIPLVAKVQGNLKEYVCHKMDKRIDAIIKKTTKERAKKLKQQEELEIKEEISNNGRSGGDISGSSKKSAAPLPKRPKPTLPDIDVILANASEDIRLPARTYPARAHTMPEQAQHIHQHQFNYNHNHNHHLHQSQYQHHHSTLPAEYTHHDGLLYGAVPLPNTSQRSFGSSSSPSLAHAKYHCQQHSEYSSSPPRRHQTPVRHTSRTSANSNSDGSSPIPHPNSIDRAPSVQGISLILPHQQASRFYTQQQQFQQSYQSRHLQYSYNSPPPSQLQPVQSQQYHDINAHTSFQRSNTGDPEQWPAHYGFAVENALSETPSSTEHFSEYRPDSGVLPNTNDPYYVQMTSLKVECRDDDLYGDSKEIRLGLVRTHSKSGNKVYRPDKTEIEQYDSLYRGITESHLPANANRSMSVQSKSSGASTSTRSDPSYAVSLRHHHRQQHQDTHRRTESSILDAAQGIDSMLQALRHQTSFESRCLEPLSYQDPDRPVSVLIPPQPTFMSASGASGLSNAGSSMQSPSSSPQKPYDRLLHQPISPAASHISLIRVSTEQLRTQSMTSTSTSYTRPASPSCSIPLREFTPVPRDEKQELGQISVPPPPDHPLPPVPVVTTATVSPAEPLRIEDVIDDIASTLASAEKTQYPQSPTTSSLVFSPGEHGSRARTPTVDTPAIASNLSQRTKYFQNHDESSHKVEITNEILDARKESLDIRTAPGSHRQEEQVMDDISSQHNYPYLQRPYQEPQQSSSQRPTSNDQHSASSISLNANSYGVSRSGSPSHANITASSSVSSLSGHKMSHLASAIRASMESTRPSNISTLSRPSGERARPSMDKAWL
ncbi:hypothetical protein BGZ93_002033 [Podila epicladia]|nr:hypothetical protein BGZ92_004047 [Podila epicladia]KAG0083113.1 hypothetical protein BGZ93_002033 [Podila epicladia]